MARNEEKAMNLFNKWQTYKTEFHSKSSNRRPLVASECDSAGDAEKFRREIIRDLTKKTALIANASLGIQQYVYISCNYFSFNYAFNI